MVGEGEGRRGVVGGGPQRYSNTTCPSHPIQVQPRQTHTHRQTALQPLSRGWCLWPALRVARADNERLCSVVSDTPGPVQAPPWEQAAACHKGQGCRRKPAENQGVSVGWLNGFFLTSQQHGSVSQGRICSGSCTFCYRQIEAADQICYLNYCILTPGQPTPALTL